MDLILIHSLISFNMTMLRFGLTILALEVLISTGRITLIALTTADGTRATTGLLMETNVPFHGTMFLLKTEPLTSD